MKNKILKEINRRIDRYNIIIPDTPIKSKGFHHNKGSLINRRTELISLREFIYKLK